MNGGIRRIGLGRHWHIREAGAKRREFATYNVELARRRGLDWVEHAQSEGYRCGRGGLSMVGLLIQNAAVTLTGYGGTLAVSVGMC